MADNLRKYKSRYSSTANSFGTGTAVTITPNSVVGLPTSTEITLTFDRVNSSGISTPGVLESITGSISGGNFVIRTSPGSGRGADSTTEQAHTSPVVEMVWNSADWNDMIAWAITEHNQSGTHNIPTSSLVGDYGVDTGTTNALAVTLSPVPTLTTGMKIRVKVANANTGATTLNVNGTGVKTIKKADGTTDLVSGDLKAGKIYGFDYDGTNFQLLGGLVDTTATQTLTNKTIDYNSNTISNLPTASTDGWTTSSDTWTYASATSFTIAGVDRTATYTKGTRIKLTQTTAKYFVVTSSSFSTNTTVNITAGTDYTLANAAITLPFYSYQANPQGYPGWFNYTPTFTGFSSAPTTLVSRFSVTGNTCSLNLGQGADGTSNATSFTISTPITSANITNSIWVGIGQGRDNGGFNTSPTIAQLSSNASTMSLYKDASGAAWTATGGKRILNLNMYYEI